MRTPAPPLLPIFRSRLQGELLALILLSDEARTVTQLASLLSAPIQTVQREVSRLEEAGIVASQRIGATRLVRADRSSPINTPLAELVMRTFGPTTVLGEVFADVVHVERVEIFGSWAARFHGERGAQPGDIDVLVVGDPDRDGVFDAAQRAERRLGRPVNTVIVSAERWSAGTEAFVQELKGKPRVEVLDRKRQPGE